MDQPFAAFSWDPHPDQAGSLPRQLFFAEQDVDRKDKGDEEVEDAADQRSQGAEGSVHDLPAFGFEPFLCRSEHAVPIDIHQRSAQRMRHELFLVCRAQLLYELSDALGDDAECVDELRDDEQDHAEECPDDEQHREQERRRPSQPL